MITLIAKRTTMTSVYKLMKLCDKYKLDIYWAETQWYAGNYNNTQFCSVMVKKLDKKNARLTEHISGIIEDD